MPVSPVPGLRMVIFEPLCYVCVEISIHEFCNEMTPILRALRNGPLPVCETTKFNPQIIRKCFLPLSHFLGKIRLELYLKSIYRAVVLVSRRLINQRNQPDLGTRS